MTPISLLVVAPFSIPANLEGVPPENGGGLRIEAVEVLSLRCRSVGWSAVGPRFLAEHLCEKCRERGVVLPDRGGGVHSSVLPVVGAVTGEPALHPLGPVFRRVLHRVGVGPAAGLLRVGEGRLQSFWNVAST